MDAFRDMSPLSRHRRHKLVRLLVSTGCGCLVVMVLTHDVEALHLLAGMGWGEL